MDANDARVAKLPFWKAWTPKQALFELAGPILVIGSIAWFVQLLRVGFGTMFDDAHVGSTVVGSIAAVIALIVGGYGTNRLLASRRSTVLSAPCPCCGAVRVRRFEGAAEKAPPTACGSCIAYLRATGTELREEPQDASDMIWRYYVLASEQYLPAVQKTNRGYYKFEMPTMCAVCGDTHATHHRDIGNGDALGKDLGIMGAIARNAVDFPSRQRDQRVGSTSEPTEAEQNSKGLSELKAPVCAKHTSDASVFGDALGYSSGKLEFASYRFYKAFCEMNHIERAPAAVKG